MQTKQIIGIVLGILILLGFLSIPIFIAGWVIGLLSDLIIIVALGIIVVVTGLASGAL